MPDAGAAALSYAHGVSERPLLGETIDVNLARTVDAYPDREAIVSCHQGVRLTYAQLDAEVGALARALLAAGLGKGDRVGIWSPNRVEWALVQYATARVGVVLVNINPSYRAHELRYALSQSGCRMLIAAARTPTSDYVAMTEQARGELPELERAVFFDTPDWEELLDGAGAIEPEELRRRAAELDFSDPINIQYTSGTTGFPKGATLSHHNILNNGYFVGEGCGITEQDRICVPVPYYHCFGMVMGNLAAISHGACIVLPSESFDAGAVLEAVQSESCTALYGVPTMFIAELEHSAFDSFRLDSLRTGIMAGAPCPEEVMRKVIERMHMDEVTICYGMTETSPVSTQTGAQDDLEHRTSTVGRVMPHVEIRVADPNSGRTLPRGSAGELQTRGYSVMLGYWNDAARTEEAIDAAQWMHTGDLAVMEADGYVKIVGRSKDMIIRGGENVYPREIEEFLYSHPDLADVQVVGVPDERYGEEITAFVIPRDGRAAEPEAVREFCRGRIAHYKVPRYVIVCESFPLTVTGKVQKYKLRQQAIAALDASPAGERASV
ncbi:MAG: AMP-binding protein [Actinomycetota bacterium]|nr:AMP-binding protein [Actinomycetota bacterium]